MALCRFSTVLSTSGTGLDEMFVKPKDRSICICPHQKHTLISCLLLYIPIDPRHNGVKRRQSVPLTKSPRCDASQAFTRRRFRR